MSVWLDVSKWLPANQLSSPTRNFSWAAVPQLLLAHQVKSVLDVLLKKSLSVQKTPLSTDQWGFYSWYQVNQRYKTIEALYHEIRERKSKIHNIKEVFRTKITDPSLLSLATGVSKTGAYTLSPDQIICARDGISGTYFVLDQNSQPRYVIKPLDEEPGALNNPKGFATPFVHEHPIRDDIPLYGSTLREAAASRIASVIGMPSIVPKTTLAVFECDSFHDLIDQVTPPEIDRYRERAGSAVREKLCSVQEFVQNSKSLFEGLQELQSAGLSDQEIADRFDSQDFEEANILIWTTYDTDAHSGNILVYPKGVDAIGNEILGIRKIDNGFSFPTKNQHLRNNLQFHPRAKCFLSDQARSKIAAMDPNAIAASMTMSGLQTAIPAMRERIEFLKKIALNPNLTIHQINSQMEWMGNR